MPDNVKSWREIAQEEKQRVNPPAVTDEIAVDTTNMQGLDKEYITADYVQPDVLPQGDRRTAEDAVIPNDDEKPLSQRISEGGRRIGNMFNAGVDKAGAILSRAPEGAYDQFAAMHNFAKRYGAVPTMPAMPYSEEISEKTGIHNRLAEYLDERSAQFEADAEAINPGQERSFQGAIQQGDYGLAAENLFGMVAQSIPTTLAIMATRNVAGGAGSTAIMTGGFAAENQQEMLESKPDMDREVLQLASGIKGYAESFFENTFGAGAMGDALSAIIKSGGKQTAKLGLKDGLSKWFTNMVIKNPKLAMFGEMFEEINTQIVQNAVDKYSGYDPERDLMSGVVDAGASGLLMGGVFSATAEGVNRVQNRKNRAKYISNLTSNQKTALKSILNDSGDPSDILNELDSFTSTMDNDTRIGVYTYAGLKIADVGSAIMQRNAERNEAVRRIDEQVNNVVATNKHNTLDNIIAVTDDEGNTFFVKEGLIAQNENGAILGDELLVVVDEQGNKSMMPKSKVTGVDSKPTSDVANEMKARGIQDSDAAINALHSQNRQEDDILVSEGQQFVTPDGRNIMIASELGDVTGKDGRPVKMFAIEVNGELQDNPVDEKALASMIKESVAAEEAAKVQEVAQAAQKQAQAQARQDTETQVQKPEDVDYDALLQSDPQAFYTAFSEEFGEQEAANTLQGVKNAIQVKIKALETKMTKSSSLNEIAKIKREIATLRTQLNTYDNVTAKQTEGTGTDNAQDAPVTTPVLQPTQQERVSTDPVVGEQDAQQDGDVTPELEAIPPVTETKVPTLTEEQAARQGLNEREIPQKPVFTAEQKEATTEPDTDVGIINSTKNDIQQTLDNAIYNPLKPEKTTTERLSIADVLKMQDPSYAIERGGKNQIGNRIERAKEFLLTKPKQLEPSIIYFRDDGTIGFQDGRHRLLAAQDLGAEYAHFEIDNTSEQQERLTKFKQGESWKKIKQQPEPEITQPPKPVENYEEVMPVAGNRRIVRLTDNGRVVLKVVDANDIEVDSKKQSSALTQMRKEYDFDQGKTVTELFEDNEIDQDEIADNETFEQSVIKHSQNPAEVLNVMGRIPIYTPIDELDAKEHAIWLNMTKITGKSWNRFADRNMMTMTIARAYLSSKEGRGIDQIATEASSTLEMEVTPQDVVDFILRYPNGSQMFERQNTPEYLDAADRFYKLTGLAPTKNLIERYADFMPKANRVNALSDAVAEVVEMRLQSGEDEQMIYDAIMQELKYLEESSQLISQEEYNNLFLQQNQSEDESEPTTEDESTDTGGDRGSGDGNGNQDEGEPGDGYKTPENEVETREAKVKRLENELRVKSREYGKAARTYQRLKDKYENSPEYGGKGQTDINGNIAGSDVLDFGDGKETRKLVETAKKEAEALRADVDRIQSELDALNNVSDNQTDMLGGLFAADNTEQKPISPVRVNGMFVINENGSVSKEFRDKINTLKKSNDQAGLNDVYTTIRIILNGVAQSKGDATVKEFEALKSELDEYAKSKKPQPTNVVDFLESVPEKPRSIKQIIKKLELENKSTIPKIPVEKVFLNPVGETPSGSRTEVDKYIESESISELPIESIKVSDIIPTQKNLTTNNIESTVNVDEKPVLLNVNGKYYVMDGHHRIANRILAGDKTVDAYVYTEKKTPTKKAERTKNYGKSNKVVSEDAKNAALERMRKRRNNLNTGIDPQDMLDGITVAVYHVEAGTRKFTEWAKEMMADMGDWVKPYLKSWYNAVRDYPGMEDYESDMTSYDEVKKFDLTKIENSSTFDNIKENSDVSDRPDSSQRDSQDTKPEISTDEKNVPGNRTGSRQDGDQTQETGGTGIGQRGGKSGSGLFTDLFGESVDNKLHSTNKKQGTKNDDAGNFDGRGNDLTRTNGNNDNDTKASEQSSKADEGVSTSFIERTRQRIAQQKKVEATPVKIMDEANIRETLPVLLPEQQDDVLKAETRFFSDEHKTKERAFGKGMLFTNGTGTGKTYTGLGIIKRFAKQGKDNILIVVPSEAKIKDWIADGVNLNLDITALENTKDQGKGINITTYATFRANENLKNRDFDLIVYDESHRLMEEKNGAASSTTRAHYLHSNVSVSQAFARLTDVHPAWIRLRGLLDDYRNMNVAMNNDIATFPEQAADEIKEIEKLLNEADAEVKRLTPEIMKRAEQAYAKTKVVFLSATPFKGHFNLRYANESLFDWGNETTYESASRGQSRVHPEGRFFLDNFGAAYEWKFHRLQTRSNANAEAIAMQEVAFAEKLIKDGVMSGRAIESDKDYSREFPLVALDQSEVMNAAFSDIFNYETREFDEMMSSAREVFYNYQYSTRLFESLKASMSIDRIKKHLDKGRKVVVFHRRKLANVQPPFKLILQETRNAADALLQSDDPVKKQIGSRMMQQTEAFEKKYAGLLKYEQTLNYDSAIDQIIGAFGIDRVGLVNGDVSKKQKVDNIRQFNNDKSGVDILIVQEEAGKEGISLHDTSGKHQRVLISLSMPISSTTALQIEGRIFRIGQETDAIFEYPLLGLNMEIENFGRSINRKLSTTENLAIGDQSRDLLRSFAEGVLFNSSTDDPNDNQGIGGKEYDKREKMSISDFQKAILVYNTNQKKRGRRDSREGVDYYATPEPVGQKMVEWLNLKPNDVGMEPSAGHGAIAMWFPESVSSVVIEPSYSLFSKLNARAGGGTRKMINSTFEEFNVINKVNGIAMNPPFGSGGKMAMDHIEKAFKHLKPYGRIVALIPNGGSMNKRLDNFLYGEDDKGKLINPDAHIIADIKLPSSTFEQAGTSVNTRIVVIDKLPPDKTLNEIRVEVGKEQTAKLFQGGRSAIMLSNEQADAEAQKRFDAQKRANIHIYNYDLSDAKNIDELFERIEFIELPARIKSPEVKEETEQQPDEKAVEPSGSGYETFTHTHTKTGEQMYMVKFADRVDRDEYDRVNSLAKRFGKGWNKFAKGFHFTSEEDRQNFLDKAFTKGKESKQNNISLLYESEELYNEHKKDEDQKAFSKETNDKAEERISEILREPGYVYPGRGESTLSPKIKPRTVVRGFKESGYVDFIGQKIESPQDIADLFAVHRSPYIEKAHVVFVKNGVIVGTTASTLNVAGRTRMPDLNHVDDLYHKYEADGMYYLHNHPSGNHLVSLQDVYVTFAHKEAFDQTGINLIGHIVIDTDKFSYIDAGNKPNDYKDRRELEVYTENVKSFSYKNPVAKLFSDRENINENNDPQGRMFQIAKALLGEKGYKGAIVYLSNNLSITGYDVIPEGATVDQIKRKTKGAIKRNVGSRVIIIHDGSTEYSWSYLPGAVLDVINTKKMSSDRYLSAQEVEDNESTYKELWDNEAEYTRNIVNPKTGLYSPTELALQNVKQDKGTPDQMKAMLLKNGAKQAELDYMGWDEAFGLQDLDPTKTIAGKGVKVIITKADIQQWIDENKIEVEEVRKGTNVKSYKDEFGVDRFEMTDEEREIADADVERGLFDDTKFSGYQLPGGENYKEVLLTMPGKSKPKLNVTKESWTYGNINGEIEKIPGDIYQVYKSGKEFFKAKNLSEVKNGLKERISDYDGLAEEAKGEFKSSHFDEPNIIAHVRFNERTGENGERVLFLEEIQSDWAQKGKKEGFKGQAKYSDSNTDFTEHSFGGYELKDKNGKNISGGRMYDIDFPKGTSIETMKAAALKKANEKTDLHATPNMPFKQTPQWVNLALRRMIRYAAENGFDRVAWTTGEQQAERYDLSKQVENVIATPRDNGLYDISIGLKGNTRSEDYKSKTPEQLEGIIGKELTQKIVNNEGTRIPRTTAKNPIKYNYEGNDLKVGGEGMKDFYDNIIKSTASKLIKKYGGRVETIEMETGTQQSFTITPELAQVAMSEGMPLFSLLGKKGAAQLDRAEEATTRLDNLNVAREMETAGKSAKEIKLATGWERGTDGKWRYDLPDKGFKINEPKVGNEPVRGKLSDFVEHPALFKAYPELKDLEMVFYREGQLEPYKDNLEAYNDGKEIGINTTRLSRGHMGGIFGNTRLVNNDTPRDNGLLLKEKVIHEAQHAIQRLEGFTGGTSRSNSGAIEYRQERIDKAKDDIKFLTEFAQNSTGKNKLDAERSIRKLKERISKLESGELDYEYYKNAAGEVEARNASKRMAMTDEERKQNPISSTEDVARESQVLITGESLNAFESETRPDEPENAVDLITNDYAQKVYSFEKKAREQAEKVADNLGVKVKVVASEDEIPSKYLNSMQAKGLSGRAQAFYSPETGEIYIILANIRSTDEIRKIIFHEAVGHKGLRLVFGRKYNRLLDSIYSQMTNEQIAEIEELGYNVADPREIADEFLAYKAPYAKKPNFIQKAIAKIREWIRQLIGLDYSENDVNYLFDLSQKALGKQKEYDNVVDFLNDGVRAEVRKVTPPNKTVNEPLNAVEYLENFRNETPGTGSANNRNNSKQPLGETITIGGKERPTKNSNGQYIAGDEASIRKFYEWFGDSKVVDEKGRPLVVYHGTDKMFDSFKDDVTYFTPDKNEANGYAQYRYGKGKARTVSVYLKIENEATEEKLNEVATKLGVYDNTEPLAPLAQNVSVKNELIKQGYDGVMNINDFGFLSDFNEIQVHVIFSNSQIKSATGNNGDYNPDDDDIRFAVKVNGKLPESVNKEVDMRLKANRGLKTETMKQKLARWKSEIKDTARHFKHITQKDYPSVYNKLRLFESIPDVARKQAYDRIAKIVRPIASNKTLFEAFEKYIVLRDLNSDIERGKYDGKELPWGYNSPQEVKTDVLNLMKFMYQNPTLRDAIAQRDEFMQEVRDQLIDNGMLPESSKENKYYFHHQVHLYMESKFEQLVSAKGADVRNKSKGWQKSRTGSMLDYNTNYIESEFEVMVQSLEQIKIKESLNKLGAEINIMPALVERVKNEGGRYQDYIPDGYVRWYPIKGTHPYKAASMAEKAIQNILQQDPDNADLDRLVAEADMNIWIIPQPVAKQLNDMKDSERENFLVRGMGSLNSKWKQWVLINPYRVLKYNLNNMSGDLDIVLAFDPRILKPQYAHKAMLELRDNVKGNIMSEDMMEAMEQGVITSGLTIQEIPEINSEGVFKSLTGSDHLIAKYWRKSKDYTQFRENMLRLAAYKYFKDQVRKGVKTYGASEKASVDAITDPIEKAGKLARELIGDYGNLSRGGIWMRSHVYPFWSWVEINAPRYYRLLKNTRHEEMDNASGKRVGGVIAAKVGFNAAKLSFKMMLLSGLVTLWNSLFFPDEDDELDKAGNRRLNLIVGRREDGSIMTVRINGAFSDMLSWADLEDAPLDVKEVASGKVTPMKKAKEAGSAFVNKFAQGLMPFEKLTAEIISGKSFYPDVFNPRPIRDKGEHASRMVSMDKLYRYLTKKPLRGAKELTSLLIYDADPGETSYYTMRQRIYDFLDEKEVPSPSGSPTERSNALYYYKQSVKLKDEDLADYWYEKYMELGGSAKGMKASIKKGEVLAPLPKAYRDEFIQSLDNEDMDVLRMAEAWYDKTYK